MTIQERASQYSGWFEVDTRVNGKEFYKLRDGYPKELKDLIYEAHDGMLPDDWKYKFVRDALIDISESDDPEEPELEPDIYNHERLSWLASRQDRSNYVDEWVEEFGMPKEFNLMKLIGLGQLKEKEEVYWSVLRSLEELEENEL